MRYKRYQICLFVGYLGLLLNLGDSLHHAEIFGLHGDGCASACCHSCCDHSSSDHDHEYDVESVGSDHDCSFCKFFAQYHATDVQIELSEQSSFTLLPTWDKPDEIHAVILTPLARGPPSAV